MAAYRRRSRELCLVLLSGRVNIEGEGFDWQNLGDRQSVFEDKSPFAAYLPPGTVAPAGRAAPRPASRRTPDATRARPPR